MRKKVRDVERLVEAAASSLRQVIGAMKDTYNGTDAAQAFESTRNLVSSPVFKADALQIVKRVIQLLALRGRDYAERQKEAFAVFDPSAVALGFVLGQIKVMRRSVAQPAKEVRRYGEAIEKGSVFAGGLAPPALAHILTRTGETLRVAGNSAKPHPSMRSCLSSILSLWHSAVTRGTGKDREYPSELLQMLKELEVVEPFQ